MLIQFEKSEVPGDNLKDVSRKYLEIYIYGI